MSKTIIVLGSGLVGATIARDLAADESIEVTIADLRPENLAKFSGEKNIRTVQVDLTDTAAFTRTIAPFDAVVGALSSAIGYATLRSVIEAGKPYCDISFMAQDAREHSELAKKHGVTAIVDCGVAPGLSNLLTADACRQLDEVDDVQICVGGLPKNRQWPFEYKAPFAPIDVVAEYTRPSRVVVNGEIVTKEALCDPELIDLPRAGTLESFITDGLRSLTDTIPAKNMCERTLRYPGHCELMRVFRETGFFNEETIDVRGVKVRPIDVTSTLLFPKWKHDKDEAEFTVMRVVVEGSNNGKRQRHTYDLYDEFDETTKLSSMSRTTGFPAAIVARLLAEKRIDCPGVYAPEMLAEDADIVRIIREELANRGVTITETVIEL